MNTANNFLNTLPKATKILLFINVGMFGLAYLMPQLNQLLALHYYESPLFKPHQLLSHLFMHGGLAHLAFNMYALVMFGSVIERTLGTKRFLLLYFFSAIGAFLLHMGIVSFELSDVAADIIKTGLAQNGVIPEASIDRIVVSLALDEVVVIASVDDVIARSTGNVVIAISAVDAVV